MSQEMLIDALKTAVAASPNPDLTRAYCDDINPEAVQNLSAALSDEPYLNQVWGKFAVLPSVGWLLQASSAAIYLTDRARRGNPAENIITELFSFAETGEVEYVSVRPILGRELINGIPEV
jgi:hypothetical protein